MPTKRVVYTALMGGYEELQDQPLAKGSAIDFVCFTDQPDLRSADWDVRLVEPILPADSIRSARALKIRGHPSLTTYQETLWIDNRVRLTTDPSDLFDEWLAVAQIALPRHSLRADVVTEFQTVLALGMEDSSRLYEQLTHYSALGPELLHHAVPWTGILARRRTPEVDIAMERWLHHVLRYSRRDQLSFVQALHEARVAWSSVDLDNLRSAVHEWREPIGRSPRTMAFQVADSLQPPTAALGEQRLSFEATIAAMESAALSQRRTTELVERENAELRQRQADDLEELGRLRRRLRRLRRKKLRLERDLASYGWRPRPRRSAELPSTPK
jgi:hypothetical protein